MLTDHQKEVMPYGLWPSSINSELLGLYKRFSDVQWAEDDLIWLEKNDGRGSLFLKRKDDAPSEISYNHSIQGKVGYGGGEFVAGKECVVYANRDGRLYCCDFKGGFPQVITPSQGVAASPTISPDNNWVVYVFNDGAKYDCLGIIDIKGGMWPQKLSEGADFYMQPVWHPGGNYIAWIEWNHPNMPWDCTKLVLASVENDSSVPKISKKIVFGEEEGEKIFTQPEFSPDGKWLSYVRSVGEWDELVLFDLETQAERVIVKGDNYLISLPAWVQGMRFYGWTGDAKRIYYLCNYAGESTLWKIDIDSQQSMMVNTKEYTNLRQISVCQHTDKIALLAGSPAVPERVIVVDDDDIHINCRSGFENFPRGVLPSHRHVSWKADDGTELFGVYYPPTSNQYFGEGLPPVIVNVHGGPTGCHEVKFVSEIVYFTSRGYAWFEVNYRGSFGYGLSYQNALRGQWGKLDVEDAVSGARALVKQELADEKRMIIRGSSAGGYTVLNSLIMYPDVFKAGLCLYGVSNLYTLTMDTHKFEEKYLDRMVGVLPDDSQKYYDWSPIYHIEKMKSPLAVFQGTEDKVVPQNQAEEIISKLNKNKVPYVYRLYEEEGHGFRKSKTINDYLTTVEKFLLEHVIFSV